MLMQMLHPTTNAYLYMMRSPTSLGEGGLFGGTRRQTTEAADLCDLFSLAGTEFRDILTKLPDKGAKIKELIGIDRELKTFKRRQSVISQIQSKCKQMPDNSDTDTEIQARCIPIPCLKHAVCIQPLISVSMHIPIPCVVELIVG